MVTRILCLAIGYGCGLFQTGYLYGKMHNIDIRNYGSGNSGATNAMRVLGKKAGLIVFLGDAVKTILACLIAKLLFADSPDQALFMLYAGFGSILGHNFPFYLNFKGGKGIAATAGILASLDWRMCVICALIFATTVLLTKYVSLGSIFVVTAFFIMAVVWGSAGDYRVSDGSLMEFFCLAGVLMLMAIWRHRANIKRLMSGTENKVGGNKKK